MANKKISELTSAGSLTGAELIEVSQSGNSRKATTQDIADLGGLGYLVYTASLNTDTPTATVRKNTLGGAVTWSKTGTGTYQATSAGLFTTDKTDVFFGANTDASAQDTPNFIRLDSMPDASTINIYVINSAFSPADGNLSNISIEIRVYP